MLLTPKYILKVGQTRKNCPLAIFWQERDGLHISHADNTHDSRVTLIKGKHFALQKLKGCFRTTMSE